MNLTKLIFLITISAFIAPACHAQEWISDLTATRVAFHLSPKNTTGIFPMEDQFRQASTGENLRHWRRVRNTGIILTFTGVATVGFSSAIIANSVAAPAGAAIGFLGGLLATGGGITMWAIGGHQHKKAKNSMKANYQESQKK